MIRSKFISKPLGWLLDDGRKFKLYKDFVYYDSNGLKWIAPAGYESNGASVPRLFWIFYPPLTGKYRSAAIIHDWYCEFKTRPWRDVHNVFKEMCLACGVSSLNASILHLAVYCFGPKWETKTCVT